MFYELFTGNDEPVIKKRNLERPRLNQNLLINTFLSVPNSPAGCPVVCAIKGTDIIYFVEEGIC